MCSSEVTLEVTRLFIFLRSVLLFSLNWQELKTQLCPAPPSELTGDNQSRKKKKVNSHRHVEEKGEKKLVVNGPADEATLVELRGRLPHHDAQSHTPQQKQHLGWGRTNKQNSISAVEEKTNEHKNLSWEKNH